MALYIPHCIFRLASLLYVRPETFGPYYVWFIAAGDINLTQKHCCATLSSFYYTADSDSSSAPHTEHTVAFTL